jgi:hypothetical protein
MDELAKLYGALELEPGATADEIKAAYLDLVKVWHPDRYQNESPRLREKAEQKLKSINLAYDRLRGVVPKTERETWPQQQPAHRVSPDLFACDFGSGWGYVDREGKLMIRPRFESADQFSEGLAHVSECGRHGFINWQGEYVIHPHYSNARNFSEGLAAVVFSMKWGYIDTYDRYTITPLYDDCGDFSEGLAMVLWRGRWGYIDRTGKFEISPRFDEARKFVNGAAEVRIGERWGRVSRAGEIYFGAKPGALE